MKPIRKLIIIYLLFSFLLLTGCQYFADPFLPDVSFVIDRINSGESEIDYEKYIKIEMYKSRLLFDHTTEEGGPDDEACNLIYEFRVINISDETIKVNLKRFVPPELNQIIIAGQQTEMFSPHEYIVLKPGERIHAEGGVLMRHYNKLSEEEKEIFNKYKDTLYFELRINGKKAYVKVSS
ncbi:hypothetical protein [Thermoanaerobacter sp. X514]|uniref:hypothetical protein n=1 Tax=Thermoanaerobacter sp. (strain X514) TaxID=399726 RepID=UPI0000E1DF31|nr:hypothetical protein [Thermoanaerobacter sp. X514]ABY91471.1 hypothetical protein Teth514_0151 [Thermoanaerobacter sp. X514]